MNPEQAHFIVICSDSVGETAEAVVRATLRQFESPNTEIKRVMNVRTEDEISAVMDEVHQRGGFVAYTLVQPELREAIREEAVRLNVRAVDIMGPMMQAFIDTFKDTPKRLPGLLHRLDEDYFRRVEAVEFAVNNDDGKDVGAILKADLVLLGVSRVSKTPLSIFLAHKGFKTMNYPVVPELAPPTQLREVSSSKLVGLTIDAEQLVNIRAERLKSLGLPDQAHYASLDRVRQELDYALELYESLGCPIIDITGKAIEETAVFVMKQIRQR